MKKLLTVIIGSCMITSYCGQTRILSEKTYDVSNGISGNILYVKAPDGHEYIISSVGAKLLGAASGGGTNIIHAEGCKKCEEIKLNEMKIKQENSRKTKKKEI